MTFRLFSPRFSFHKAHQNLQLAINPQKEIYFMVILIKLIQSPVFYLEVCQIRNQFNLFSLRGIVNFFVSQVSSQKAK